MTADSDKCRCVKPEGTYGGVKCPSRWPPTPGSLVPPRPKEEVLFNVFEPKLVDSLLYVVISFLIVAHNEEPAVI